MTDALRTLQRRLADFAAARDWEQFHSPKNLAMALSVEAAEVVEEFQWLTEAQSENLDADRRVDADRHGMQPLRVQHGPVGLVGAFAKLMQRVVQLAQRRFRKIDDGHQPAFRRWRPGSRHVSEPLSPSGRGRPSEAEVG